MVGLISFHLPMLVLFSGISTFVKLVVPVAKLFSVVLSSHKIILPIDKTGEDLVKDWAAESLNSDISLEPFVTPAIKIPIIIITIEISISEKAECFFINWLVITMLI